MSEINNIHDKCKQVIMFHNNLVKFLTTLKKTLPESARDIAVAVKYYKSQPRADYITETQKLMEPLMQYVAENDQGIFSDDFSTGPVYLLPKLDLRKIFETIDNSRDFQEDAEFSEQTKISIFKHLQAIYISSNMALQQIGLFNRNMEKQKEFLMNMLENLKVDDEVKKRIEELKQEEEDEKAKGNKGGFGMDKIASLLGEDNFVFQIAKDIAEELDLGNDEINDPVEAIKSLFANDGRKIQELIVTVGDKLEQKIESGEVDKERLIRDAKKVHSKLGKFTGKIPGFDKLLNNEKITEQLLEAYNQLPTEYSQQYSQIPELLKKPMMEWNEQEKQYFDAYGEVVMNLRKHGDLDVELDLPDIDESENAQPSTGTKARSKSEQPKVKITPKGTRSKVKSKSKSKPKPH